VNGDEDFRIIWKPNSDAPMIRRIALTCLATLVAGIALAYEARDPELWERENAWRLSHTPQSATHAAALMQRVRAGDNPGALAYLKTLDADPALPAPARERLLFEFVHGLRDATPGAVGPAVLNYLRHYPSTVLVPDLDHPRMQVPLFSVRTATAGLENDWLRQESILRGRVLLDRGAGALVAAYLGARELPEQRGLLDALETSSPMQRTRVAELALEQLDARPELAELVGTAALLNEDGALLSRLLTGTTGQTGVHRLLRDSAMRFAPATNAYLLETALDQGTPETAALAIAELGPALSHDPRSVDRLFTELGVAETGAAAALALAANPDPEVLTRLEGLAAGPADSLIAARARLALHMIEAAVLRDTQ
jgi:hypothetical protein